MHEGEGGMDDFMGLGVDDSIQGEWMVPSMKGYVEWIMTEVMTSWGWVGVDDSSGLGVTRAESWELHTRRQVMEG